tara:strand:- start:403 stop:1062 length:660 start_codon:yes stop_codon:yes gene_type:complete
MTVGVVILVLITSAGIFGFLSNAYQGATIQFEKQSATLFYQEDRLEQLEEDKAYLKDELEQTISLLPDNYPTAKRKVREEYNPKVFALNDQILEIKQEIGDLKVALVETGVDVGPAIYLARIFDTDIDTVVKFFIFILIFVFDPMAVALVISYNVITHTDKVVVRTKKIKKNKKKNGIRKSKEIVINDNKTDIIDNDNTDIYEEGNISRMEKGGVTPSG